MKRLIVGLIISLVALWWAFKGMDWQAFKEALTKGNMLWIAASSLVLLSVIPLRGLRWCIFMEPVKKVPVRLTTEATIVGYFGNNALPFRLGELLRSYYVARQAPAPLTQVFGTVIVERVIDMLSALVLLVFLPLTGAVPEQFKRPLLLLVVLCLIVAVVTVWLARRENGIPFVKGRLKSILDNLQLGFTSLRQEQHYLTLFLTTVVIWLLYLVYIHIAQYAMGLGLSLVQSYLILVATTLVLVIPAAPGFVGTFHAAVILVCVNIFSMDPSRAQAMAVVLHAIGYIPYTIIGAILFFKSHLRLQDVKSQPLKPEAESYR
ncbi:MAG: flippase-like domain-containing protein [Fidelibacterota bacterium]|nr:MAG: flippase-like domain-containing protein [Candidatus Neomarinimicrobiota bacterium]